MNVPNPCEYWIGENDLLNNKIIDYISVSDPDGDLFQCEVRDVKDTQNDDDEFTFLPNPRLGPGSR